MRPHCHDVIRIDYRISHRIYIRYRMIPYYEYGILIRLVTYYALNREVKIVW
jgi:hypothetical protein